MRAPTNALLFSPLQTAHKLVTHLTPTTYSPTSLPPFPSSGGFVPNTPVYPYGCQTSGAHAAPYPAPPQSDWLFPVLPEGQFARSTRCPPPPCPLADLPPAPTVAYAGRETSNVPAESSAAAASSRRAWRSAERSARVIATRRPRRGCEAPEQSEAAWAARPALKFPGRGRGARHRHPFEVRGWL